jgi:hypothetical protein
MKNLAKVGIRLTTFDKFFCTIAGCRILDNNGIALTLAIVRFSHPTLVCLQVLEAIRVSRRTCAWSTRATRPRRRRNSVRTEPWTKRTVPN